ncbi:MAG: FAD-dependent oxidoreductase [Spongiibacter sp.]|uniref:NAD(P)/FAD-dependent oxidoreductase n=1 Tax=Spongiibacter thalassae TaxID=2721624 RepID=A0ABX1GCA2_9GAMM|nr:FAD-dependent oxidoreductase [Spongiibacter thalassae]MDX1505134.1 FAD-dependent oxidoreductase [Spongiibacter sp.]NKI16223.1 NAD(P)/FAD-dependent oxidoreductase [Spongiibacter thalassae]
MTSQAPIIDVAASLHPSVDPRPIIIVGTGPVGIRCAEELLKRGCQREILLFGNEPWEPYDRIRLSSLLAGEVRLESLQTAPNLDQQGRVNCHYNCPIVGIDRYQQRILDVEGRQYSYSALILATGSQPFLPGIPGIDAKRVYTFRDLNDTQQLMARLATARHVVVIGGGLLGLETARAMSRCDTRVTVIQQADRLMNRQLDGDAAALLAENIRAQGVDVLLGEGVREVVCNDQRGRPEVIGVRLRSGQLLDCDTVVVSAGIRPNIDLARRSGLVVGQGIVVDEGLATNAPNIHAIGECAEFRQQLHGLVAPGYEQAAVLAANLCGEPSRYLGSVAATQLKVVGLPVFSIGETEGEGRRSWRIAAWRYRDAATGCYRKIVLRRGRIVGAIGVGDWSEVRRVQAAVSRGDRVSWLQIARFSRSGMLWAEDDGADVASWPATALICNCRGVQRGQLTALYKALGDKQQVIARCGASTVCGSCAPLVAELCGEKAGAQTLPVQRKLLASGVLALLVVALLAAVPPIDFASTVQVDIPWDRLWSDGLYKQISGYAIVAMVVLGLYLSVNKRLSALSWGRFSLWRLVHTLTGLAGLGVLVAHTGLRLGENLNALLMMNFLLLALLGAVSAGVVAAESQFSPRWGKRLRRLCTWGHLYLAWPIPALLGLHIFSVYYF